MIVKITGGLYLFDPSTAPEGSCIRAKNVIFDRDGIVEVRKGSAKGSLTSANPVLYIFDHSGDRYSWTSTSAYKNEVSFGDTLTAARPEAVRYNAYNSSTDALFFLNGTDRKRIEDTSMYEWGTAAPTEVPTIAAGSGTGLTGDYNVKYTWIRKEGSTVVYESNFSPTAAAAVTLANEDLDVSNIESPSDSQITHVRVYRTAAGGSTYYFDEDITAGTTTVTLEQADATIALNAAAHDDDHNRPPLGTHCAGPLLGGYVFIGIDNLLYWCKAKQPEYWPTTNFIEISEPQDAIQAITDFGGTVFVFTREKIVQIQGSGSSTFAPINLEAFCGTYATNCVKVVPNKGIYHLGRDGIYLFRGADQKAFPGLDPIFDQKSADGLPNLDLDNIDNCWMEAFGDALFFAYPSTSGVGHPDTILRLNIDNNKASRFVYTDKFLCSSVDKTNQRLYVGDDGGYIWQLETGTSDGSTAIATEVETTQVNMPTREYSPRWCRYDTYCDSSDSLDAEVIVDGTSIQAHSLDNKDRSTKPRLVTNAVGNRIALRFTGSGDSIKIYARQEIE